MVPRLVAVLAVASFVGPFGCRRPTPAVETRDAPDAALEAGTARRARVFGTDVTFLVVSDTHFGYPGVEAVHERLVASVRAIEGTPYPPSIGGAVASPRGLVVTGDLTEWGRPGEWERFLAFYGPEGKLGIPVLEMVGNHDTGPGPWVRERVRERHGGHPYAWDWGDLHLVALGEAPDDAALAFLADDLEKLEPDVPVVLFMHLPLAGPWSTGHWFGDGPFRDRLAAIVDGRCILAVFHGHHHRRDRYAWHGIPVVKPGAVKHEGRYYAVVHVTDERLTVTWRDYARSAWFDGAIDERFASRCALRPAAAR